MAWVVQVAGSGAKNEIAPQGLLDKNTLAKRTGTRKKSAMSKFALIAIQKQIVTQTRFDFERLDKKKKRGVSKKEIERNMIFPEKKKIQKQKEQSMNHNLSLL